MLDDKTLEILDGSCSGIIPSDQEMVENNIEQQTHPEQNTTFKKSFSHIVNTKVSGSLRDFPFYSIIISFL